MSWFWKGKSTWRKELITYNSHSWIMFSFNWLVINWRGWVRLKLDVQDQGGGRIIGVVGQRGRGSGKLDNFYGRHMCIIPKKNQAYIYLPWKDNPVGNYLFQINSRNTRIRCEICSKLTIKTLDVKTPGVFIVNLKHISDLVLVFLLLTVSR